MIVNVIFIVICLANHYKDFRYIVIDKTPTNEIGIFNVSENFYYSGEQKVEYAIKCI